MTNPLQGMVQTLLSIRSLQQQDEAATLAREQFGLQTDISHERAVADLQNILANASDPQAFEQHIPQLSKLTGATPEFLTTLIRGARPSKATTEAGVLAKGAKAAAGKIEEPAAFAQFVGQQPGQLAGDTFDKMMIEHAQEFVQGLPADQQKSFSARVAERRGSGSKPGEVALDAMIEHMTPQQKMAAAMVGAQILPSASQDAQIRLGWANQRLQGRQLDDLSAYHQAMSSAALQEARGKLDKGAFKMVNELIEKKDQLLQSLLGRSSTLTPGGRLETSATIEAYNEQLRQLAPEIFGKRQVDPKTGKVTIVGGTVPLQPFEPGGTVAATGLLPYLGQWFQGMGGGVFDQNRILSEIEGAGKKKP